MKSGPKTLKGQDEIVEEEIYKIIKKHSGIYWRQLGKAARFTVSSPNKLQTIVKKLKGEGRIEERKEGRKSCYYPNPLIHQPTTGLGRMPLLFGTTVDEKDIQSANWSDLFKQYLMMKYFFEYFSPSGLKVKEEKVDKRTGLQVTEYDTIEMGRAVMQKVEEFEREVMANNKDFLNKKFSEIQAINNQILHRLFATLLLVVHQYNTVEIDKKLKRKMFMSAINEICNEYSEIFHKVIKAILVGMMVEWKLGGDDIFTKRYLHEAFDLKSEHPT